jgi:hypothetical protein
MAAGCSRPYAHVPFGNAFYFGQEKLSERYEDKEKERAPSGFGASTYSTVFERIDKDSTEVRPIPSCISAIFRLTFFFLFPPSMSLAILPIQPPN